MNDIIKNKGPGGSYELFETIIKQLYLHEFFPWTCLVLIISHNNMKRPIILLMVLHWALRCMGDIFVNTIELYDKDYPYWPYSNVAWFNSYGIASIFWYSSEIIGDWYLVIRTKALIRNNQKLRWVLVLCIIYNVIKVVQMVVYPSNVPFINVNKYDEKNEIDTKYPYLVNLANHKLEKWTTVILQQFGSLAFDISVIITLKKYFFNKKTNTHIYSNNSSNGYKQINANNFFQKFKTLSEYRIYLSIFVTIIGFPFILAFCIGIMYTIKASHNIKDREEYIEKFGIMCDDQAVDSIRVFVLNFSYFFMYIDQILLKYYVEENNATMRSSSNNTNSGNNYNISYSSSDYNNMAYRKYEDNDYNIFKNKQNRKDYDDNDYNIFKNKQNRINYDDNDGEPFKNYQNRINYDVSDYNYNNNTKNKLNFIDVSHYAKTKDGSNLYQYMYNDNTEDANLYYKKLNAKNKDILNNHINLNENFNRYY